MTVRAKKHLGQHFLTDENIAKRIEKNTDETIITSVTINPFGDSNSKRNLDCIYYEKKPHLDSRNNLHSGIISYYICHDDASIHFKK